MNTENISSKAMLVDLRISRWTARKLDKRASAEVAANNAVQSGAGRYYKSLIEGDALTAINKVADLARAYHYRMTLPWLDSGPRTLKSTAYFDYMEAMQDYASQFDAAVTGLINDYPLYRQEARRLLGTLFAADDYPDTEEVKQRFGFRVRVMPLPTAGDFRVELGDGVSDEVREQIEADTRGAVKASLSEAYDRVRKVTEAFVGRLAQPGTVFRDTLVDNARELAEVLPALNFTDDPHLAAIAERLANELTRFDPVDLRKDEGARRAAYVTAKDIHKDVSDFFSGAFQ